VAETGAHAERNGPPSRGRPDGALHRLRTAHRTSDIERLADELSTDPTIGPTPRRDLLEVLLVRLGDESVRDDPDTEDALCSALVRLGLMRRHGNLVFRFRLDHELSPADATLVHRYDAWLPLRYVPNGSEHRSPTMRSDRESRR